LRDVVIEYIEDRLEVECDREIIGQLIAKEYLGLVAILSTLILGFRN